MSTLEERRAAVEKRRQERAESLATARDEQEVSDLEAIDKLEADKGFALDATLSVSQYVKGCPVRLALRAPSASEYKRYFTQVNAAGSNADAKVKAHHLLAEVCWVYPESKEARAELLEANGGLLASIGNRAAKLAELKADEEKKD
jgi:hypothetical protein